MKTSYTWKEYKTDFDILDDNMDRVKYEVNDFKTKGHKRSAINARAILMNIKKMCHILRGKIMTDIKSMPKRKRNDSEESLAVAKEKRKKTIAEKKGIKNGK